MGPLTENCRSFGMLLFCNTKSFHLPESIARTNVYIISTPCSSKNIPYTLTVLEQPNKTYIVEKGTVRDET